MAGKEAATKVVRFQSHLVQWRIYARPTLRAVRTHLAAIIDQLASPMEATLCVS